MAASIEPIARYLVLGALCVAPLACSSSNSGDTSGTGGATAGAGGSSGGGGIAGLGGAPMSSGGSNASGGTIGTGGSPGVGGATAGGSLGSSGGAAGAALGGQSQGGAASGGVPSAGGTPAEGGSSGGQATSGGQVGSGGQSTGDGGASAGGESSSGGAVAVTCPSPALQSGNSTHTIQVDNRQREYVLHVPNGYTGDTPVPLLVDFHPHGSTGPAWASDSPYPRVVDGDGVVSAFPSAVGDWNVGPCCADGVDDVKFARELVAEVEGLACIDVKRVYAAGFSMGGGMTNYVACNAADIFAAFAPAAFDLLGENVDECNPGRPITVASYRGTDDTLVFYDGGVSNLVTPITFLGAVNTMNKWAELSGCTGSASDLGNGCQGYEASQCQDGVEVILCTKQGGGHEAADPSLTWPVLKRHSLP